MKKVLLPIASVVVFIAIALGIYWGLANKNNVDLTINMKDMTVNVGETVKINYECSNKNAEVVFESKDGEIAEIVMNGAVSYVKGLKAGKARIVGTFTYEKYKNSKMITVTVVESTENTEDEGFEIDKIEFINLNNVSYENCVFTMLADSCNFSISAKTDFVINSQSVSCENLNVNIEAKDIPGLRLYKISCSEMGTYELNISINGKNKIFTLIQN